MSDILIGCVDGDRAVAEALAHRLEKERMSAVIACVEGPEDTGLLLKDAKVFILLFSDAANGSAPMLDSLQQAVASGAVVMPLRLTHGHPADEFHYYLGTVHWLDGTGDKLDLAMGLLCARCASVLSVARERGRGREKRPLWIIAVAAVLVLGIAALIILRARPAKPLSVGDTMTFGAWEGGEDLKWIVLEAGEDRLLLTSEDCVTTRRYNDEAVDTTWETASLRVWLNGEFYDAAFSDDEKARILKSEVDNGSTRSNFKYGSVGMSSDNGNDTEDYVWLLSGDESEKYFPETAERVAYLSGGEGREACDWWLRCAGQTQKSAMVVKANGSRWTQNVETEGVGVRPVISITK